MKYKQINGTKLDVKLLKLIGWEITDTIKSNKGSKKSFIIYKNKPKRLIRFTLH